MRKIEKAAFWIVLALTLCGLGLRLINIGVEPFWGDEVLSLDIVRHFASVHEMLRYLADVEIHPPLYYLLLHPWIRWFGETELPVRLLSAIFGTALIPLVYAFGKRLFGTKAGLAAALVMAVLPMQVEFGQEARPYIIYCFFGAAAAFALWEYFRSRRPILLAAYAAATVIGLQLHYSYLFIFAATALWCLYELLAAPRAERPRLFMDLLIAHAAIFLGFYPWLSTFLHKVDLSRYEIWGMKRSDLTMRPSAFFADVLNRSVWLTKIDFLPRIEILAQFGFKMLFICLTLGLLKTGGRMEGDRKRLIYLGWLALAPVVFFLFSPQSYAYAPLYQRHVIFLTVPLALFFGWLAVRLPAKRAALLLAVFVVTLAPRVIDVAANDADWDHYHGLSAAGAFIDGEARPGDLVVTAWGFTRSDLSHYLRPDIRVDDLFPLHYYGLDFWDSRETLGFVENESQLRSPPPTEAEVDEKLANLVRLRDPKRIWLYGVSSGFAAVHRWFTGHGWRHAYASGDGVMIVDLYERR